MSGDLRFDGKVALITGAGQGLGRAYALMFASRGAKVVVNDLGGSHTGGGKSSEAADRVVAEIKAAGGQAVANYDSVEDGDKLVKTAIDAFGRVDILVNNAGILRDVTFHKMTEEDWDLVLKVHVRGAFKVTHAVWPLMRDQGYGRIIFTSSAAGIYGNFGQANYSAAKLGLVGFSSTLALEGAKRNVQVNTIAPVAGSRMTETILPKDIVEALKPEYVAALVGWLCHESCTENGGLFEVGGGMYAKLRWERTVGKVFKLGRAITPETVRGAWEDITSFAKTTHPESVTAALQPVLENLQTKSRGGNEFIDVDQALGYQMEDQFSSYDERDLSIYALGVGAGAKPTDPKDLSLVYERNPDGFFALPTYAVIPPINAFLKAASQGKGAPGLNYGLDRLLHGEQFTEVLRPLPAAAKLRHQAKVSEIWDKGKNAVVVTHVDTFDADSGELLARNDISAVIRGAGGWGGERGPASEVNVPPERKPDAVVEEKIGESAALLYRLSGDWNPLHVDPSFASAFGFERPILHGLCTFGHVARHVINAFSKGDPRFFKSIKVRFADAVFPGETIRTEMWKESDTRIVLRTSILGRDKPCITHAAVELYKDIPTPAAPKKDEPAKAAAPAATADGGFSSADVFAVIAGYVESHPELKSAVNTVYQFHLRDPESTWTVDTKTLKVAAGETAKPECTLDLTDADFLAMTSGKADPQKLYFGGKLKISGNVMASQKLDFLKKIDRGSAAPPRPAGETKPAATTSAKPAGAPAAKAPAIFKALKERIEKNPKLIDEVNAAVQFKIVAPDAWLGCDLRKAPGSVSEGKLPSADATITISDEDFVALAGGSATAKDLFMHGKLRVDGDIRVAHRLGFLNKLI